MDLTLVDFDTEVRVARFSQDDFPQAGRAHPDRARAKAGPRSTTHSPSIWHGAAENAGRSVLVAFTDGGDSRSTHRVLPT